MVDIGPRLATPENIPLILSLLSEVPNPPFETKASILHHIDDPAISLFVDATLSAICWITASEQRHHLTVVWLLPRLKRGELVPLLVETIEDAKLEHDAGGWEITAVFQDGKDASGELDKGREIGQSWKAVAPIAKQRYRGDTDEYEMYAIVNEVLPQLRQASGS